MISHPQAPTLFPYATPFRPPHQPAAESDDRGHHPDPGALLLQLRALLDVQLDEGVQPGGVDAGVGPRSARPDPALQRVDQPDRRSTRLNSSHANISYAVFCL